VKSNAAWVSTGRRVVGSWSVSDWERERERDAPKRSRPQLEGHPRPARATHCSHGPLHCLDHASACLHLRLRLRLRLLNHHLALSTHRQGQMAALVPTHQPEPPQRRLLPLPLPRPSSRLPHPASTSLALSSPQPTLLRSATSAPTAALQAAAFVPHPAAARSGPATPSPPPFPAWEPLQLRHLSPPASRSTPPAHAVDLAPAAARRWPCRGSGGAESWAAARP